PIGSDFEAAFLCASAIPKRGSRAAGDTTGAGAATAAGLARTAANSATSASRVYQRGPFDAMDRYVPPARAEIADGTHPPIGRATVSHADSDRLPKAATMPRSARQVEDARVLDPELLEILACPADVKPL